MKQFFEQYGGVALGILALIVLIAMITPVGNIIKTSLQGTVQTFSTKMNGQVDTMSSSMKEAFENANQLSGIVGGKLYQNGIINETLKDSFILDDGTIMDPDGTIYPFYIDVNVVYQGNQYNSGLDDVRFNIYTDGVLDYENKKDMCVDGKFNIAKNTTYEVIVTQIPENATIQNDHIKININDFVIRMGTFRGVPAYFTEVLIVVEGA